MDSLEQDINMMRDARNEWMPKDLRDDAEDVLHMLREMTPEKRKEALGNLQEAAVFIAKAIKECQQ